ncbi:hypothetical protein [Streptomyces sp. NPDC093261]|uniref:hypothetical protein n=1 Tax=Streptomyces sp. NPDC093261 TaxID=3366037 RepID=UPI0037F62AB5
MPEGACFPVAGGDGWQPTTVPLTGLSGTLSTLAVRLTGGGSQVRRRLGGLAVRDAATTPATPVDPRNTDADGGDPRFARRPAPGAAHRAAASAPPLRAAPRPG